MQSFRDKIFIWLPVIGGYFIDSNRLNRVPQLSSSCCAAIAQYAADEPLAISINSNPYPAEVFFDEM